MSEYLTTRALLADSIDRVVVPHVIERIPKGVVSNLVAALSTSEIKERQVRQLATAIFSWFPFSVVSRDC